jgi:hypothetical protein
MASALTTKGLQTVQNLTVRNNLAVQNQLQAKHLIADNVVQVNSAHRDYGQLVLGAASKIGGAMPIDSNIVLQDGTSGADGVVLADGTISSSSIMSKALGAARAIDPTMIESALLDPTNVLLNPFVGATLPSVPTPTWKSAAELAAIRAANGSFTPNNMQLEMAKLIDAGSSTTIEILVLNDFTLLLNKFDGTITPVADTTVWQTNDELDALEEEVGSTFVASPLQRAIADAVADGVSGVLASLLDPTIEELNPFVGIVGAAPSVSWKTHAELDHLQYAIDETQEPPVASTFIASGLQRAMADAIEDGVSVIDLIMLDPSNVLVNPFLGTASPVVSKTWKTTAELNALKLAVGSTFVPSVLQLEMAVLAEASIASTISTPMLDPTDAALNPFVGTVFPVTKFNWKTNAELDAMEKEGESTFKASSLQRDMADMVDQSIANRKAMPATSAFLAEYAIWANAVIAKMTAFKRIYIRWAPVYRAWLHNSGDIAIEPYKLTYPIVSNPNNLVAATTEYNAAVTRHTTVTAPVGSSPVEPIQVNDPSIADPRKSIMAMIEEYEAKRVIYNGELVPYNAALNTYNTVTVPAFNTAHAAWVDGGKSGAEPVLAPAPVAPIAPTYFMDFGTFSFQFEVIDAAVRKTGTVYSFSADGKMQLVETLVIHSGGLHRATVYPKGAFVMQGRTRENKFIFSQVADAQIDELIDETNSGHLGDNRRVAIEAGPVISYVMAGPDELDLVPQMVFQNASEKWRVALVPDRTTYEDEYGNIVQGDGLLKLMIQRHLAVPKAVTYNDSTGTPITSNISWETVSSFVGNSGAVGVKPSSAPIGYKSS